MKLTIWATTFNYLPIHIRSSPSISIYFSSIMHNIFVTLFLSCHFCLGILQKILNKWVLSKNIVFIYLQSRSIYGICQLFHKTLVYPNCCLRPTIHNKLTSPRQNISHNFSTPDFRPFKSHFILSVNPSSHSPKKLNN